MPYSYSQTNTYAACPTRYKLRYIDALSPLTESEHDLRFGKAWDASQNAYYAGLGQVGAEQAFALAYPESEYPTTLPFWSPGKSFAGGLAAIGQYIERWREEDEWWEVLTIQSRDRQERDDESRTVVLDLVVRDRRDGLVYGVDNKAQPLDCSLLTPEGWLSMGRIRIGDKVIGSDGFPVNVIDIYPRGILPCYEITFNDGSKTKCSGDHLWTGWFSQWGIERQYTLTLDELRRRLAVNSQYKFRVPLVGTVQFPGRPFVIHPYLMGLLLGDGCIRNHVPQVSVGNQDRAITTERVKEYLPYGIGLRKCGGPNYSWSLSTITEAGFRRQGGNAIKNELVRLELWGTGSATKFIPDEYKYCDAQQRTALLQGLLDSDGCCYKGQIFFDSISLQLASDVRDLARSLGGFAQMRSRKRTGVKVLAYRVTIRFDNDIIPFRLERKLEKRRLIQRLHGKYMREIRYIGEREMQCIQVAAIDGLYVTDDYTITHNSTGKYLDAHYSMQFDPHSQIRQYVDHLQHKYGECGGFYINAASFRHRTKSYTPRKGPDKGVQLPAGDWCDFKRMVFNPNARAVAQERASFAGWVRKIEADKASGDWAYATDQCVRGPIICPYHKICSAGYTWPEDAELIEQDYVRRCLRVVEGQRCWLKLGHEGECDATRPVREDCEVEFDEEIEEAEV